jgi:4-hydroxy-2-oxoheptanedioate aldolase
MSADATVHRGIWCQLGDPVAVRITAAAGPGWICLDAQHGLFGRSQVEAALAGRADGWPPVAVRLRQLDFAEIGHALDAGADWVIVPLIEAVDQAREAVAAAFYPPLGRRSWGPLTPLWSRPTPDAHAANAAPRVWIMIETAAGLDVVEELFAVPGIGGVLVGPNDLSLSLGIDQDAMLADTAAGSPLQRILSAARAAGIATGAFGGTPDRGAAMIAQGFEWVVVGTDAAALDAGVRGVLQR